jgi:hypothetical protein
MTAERADNADDQSNCHQLSTRIQFAQFEQSHSTQSLCLLVHGQLNFETTSVESKEALRLKKSAERDSGKRTATQITISAFTIFASIKAY